MFATIPLGIVALPMTVRWFRRRRAEAATGTAVTP
jgi:hypothetical protein